ncbi:nitroreductase family protein [bacterium]|nr:nitroreductase family protein [candidate division CSSED10-310 bacterium]
MDTLEAIFTRRSIRRYEDRPVPDEQVETLLRAAMAAPSAGNQQPWHFIVIRARSLLAAIPSVHPYAAMTPNAALAICICGELTLERHEDYWVQDCSAATQNLLLAAHAMGFGAVWLGVHPREQRVRAIRNLLDMPDTVTPLAIIAIGWPAEATSAVDRFKPERIHRDRW